MLVIFAKTPEQDMVLIVDEGDGDFSGLEQVSDEQMAQVEGDAHSAYHDGVGSVPKFPPAKPHTTGGGPKPANTDEDYIPPTSPGGYGGGWEVDF